MTATAARQAAETVDILRTLLGQTLGLGRRADRLTLDSSLLGGIPELDSMAVVEVVSELERTFGITVHDDDISAQTFATLGSLLEFIEAKR